MNPQWSNQQYGQQLPGSNNRLTPQSTGWQAPMMTGAPGSSPYLQPQQTGYGNMGVGMGIRVSMQPPPPVPPMPQMQRPMQTGFMVPQPTGFPGGIGAAQRPPAPPMMMPQHTGYPGSHQQHHQQQQYQQPQHSGMLGSFSAVPSTFVSTFMPSNPNANWNNSGPSPYQLAPHQQQPAAPAPLPQFFQQHNQQETGSSTVQVQWALTADERRNYDKIFRAWDNGSGYITGAKAQEVFKESGLERDDLMKIWALADRENRGKLNLAEFHVAMGLIYRRLSGNPVPDVLPPELVPPSSRDLDQSVDFLKDLLRNDTNARSTNLDASPNQSRTGSANNYAKVRSFNASASPDPTSRQHKDATVYKHDDSDVRTYKPSSRHLDRRNVRFQGEDDSSDLEDLKRQLKDSQDLLEKSHKTEEEDEDLKQELDDLKYRIRRVKDDIEYNKSGRRSEAKDEERRRLERQLLHLMHERLPELEQKMRERERVKRSEDRTAARKRDARNNATKFDRYSSRNDDDDDDDDGGPHTDKRMSSRSRREQDSDDDSDEEDKRGYLRGSYGRNDSSKGSPATSSTAKAKENSRERRAADQDRPESPAPKPAQPAPPSPAPPTGLTPSSSAASPRPASPASKKPQTAEERQAFIRAEAQRRVQERMRLLTGQSSATLSSPSEAAPSASSGGIDSTVTERLEQEKREAAQRSAAEDKAAEEREKLRQLKLEEEKLKHIKKEQKTITETGNALKQVSDEVTASEMHTAGGNADASQAARAEIDAEERANREREAAAAEEKRKAEERIKQLEAELEASRQQAQNFESNRSAFAAKASKGPAPPAPGPRGKAAPKPPAPRRGGQPSPAVATPVETPRAPTPSSPAVVSSVPPAPAAPAPPAVTQAAGTPPSQPSGAPASEVSAHPEIASPVPTKPSSTNPFLRLGAGSATASSSSTPPPSISAGVPTSNSKSTNPFFRPPTGASPAPAPMTIPPPPRGLGSPPTRGDADDDWDDPKDLDNDSDDSDDDEDNDASIKDKRANLAGLLFGGGSGGSTPTSRPSSTRPDGQNPTSAPPPPKAPAAPLPPLGAAAGAPPPRSALLGAIQGGAKLRKAVTVDKSKPLGAGAVVGDASAPEQKFIPPPSPPLEQDSHASQADTTENSFISSSDSNSPMKAQNTNRQSVDWYGGLAADSYPSPSAPGLPSTKEDPEEEEQGPALTSASTNTNGIDPSHDAGENVHPHSSSVPSDGFDFDIVTQVRSIYSYDARGEQDASFGENLLIIAHPPKDPNSEWLYGMVPSTGSRGWLPKAYVEELPLHIACTGLYDFDGDGSETLSIQAGQKLFIGDKIDADWARVVLNGKVGLVPLSYIEETRIVVTRPATITDTDSDIDSDSDNDSDDASRSDTGTDTNAKDNLTETHRGRNGLSRAEQEARERERIRVLEAAGIATTLQQNQAGRSQRRRRPPPPRPRPAVSLRNSWVEDVVAANDTNAPEQLAGSEQAECETAAMEDVDDAFARWEAFQRQVPSPTHPMMAPQPVKQEINFNPATVNKGQPEAPVEPSRESQQDKNIGQTWSSLIDRAALESIAPEERKRQEAIFELIKTEVTYLAHLQTIVQEYFTRLQPVLDDKASSVIFANIEDILLWSVTFLSDLEDRQRACRLYVDKIGDLLLKHAPGLRIYKPYCLNQTNAGRVLAEVKRTNVKVKEITEIKVAGLTLEHYLLEPMQRLARYPLLFGQILRFTADQNEDRARLVNALGIAESILNQTNEGIRDQEMEEKLSFLSEVLEFPDNGDLRMDLTAPTKRMGKRTLIKEGNLVKGHHHLRASKRKDLRAYLFNDFLLLTTSSPKERSSVVYQGKEGDADPKVVYRSPIPLEELSVKTAREDQVFSVMHRGQEIKLQAPSVQQRREWLLSIERAKEAASLRSMDQQISVDWL